MEPSSYRPVNILSPLSKIIEKSWIDQINYHLKENKIIDQNIQGSVKGRNSSTLINEIIQEMADIKKKVKLGLWYHSTNLLLST